MVRMVAPLCDGTVTSVDELFEHANKHGERFALTLLANELFIPPGAQPYQRFGVAEAVKAYISALEGVRSKEMLVRMKTLPSGVLLLNGVIERVRPHYHLLENATELGAQPLLSQRSAKQNAQCSASLRQYVPTEVCCFCHPQFVCGK